MARKNSRLAMAAAAALSLTALAGCASTAPADPSAPEGDGIASDSSVQIYLTRHGETILNSLHRVQGWSDSPLTDAGRTTATTVGENLGAEIGEVDAAYSADMVRHFETATLMLEGMGSGLSVTRDEGLRELNFGGNEGAEQSAMAEPVFGYLAQEGIDVPTVGQLTEAMKSANPIAELPAEDCSDVAPRMLASLNAIAEGAAEGGDDAVLVVSSGLSISCLLADLGAEALIPDDGIANGAINLLEYASGDWTVESVNDTSYAEAK